MLRRHCLLLGEATFGAFVVSDDYPEVSHTRVGLASFQLPGGLAAFRTRVRICRFQLTHSRLQFDVFLSDARKLQLQVR